MKITFVRSGGFAGLRLALDVDTADLPAHEAAQLLQLIDEARGDLHDAPNSPSAPDRFEYRLAFDMEHGEREALTLCEPDVPDSVRPLIEQLTYMARRKPA
jgi:hypothetical protein